MITLKQLVYKEISEMKERRKKESFGTYYVFYVLAIIFTITTLILSIPDNEPFDTFYLYTTLWSGYVSLSFLYQYLYRIKENGTINNIFLKYKFIPVDMGTLFLAKIIVLARFITIHILPAQILAFICRVYYVYKYRCNFFDLMLFFPAITGIIYFMVFSVTIYRKYRRAAK